MNLKRFGLLFVILAVGHLNAAQPESKRAAAAGQEITAQTFLAFLDKTRDMIRGNPVQFRGQILANLAKIDNLSVLSHGIKAQSNGR